MEVEGKTAQIGPKVCMTYCLRISRPFCPSRAMAGCATPFKSYALSTKQKNEIDLLVDRA
jgi:hypothetical protein